MFGSRASFEKDYERALSGLAHCIEREQQLSDADVSQLVDGTASPTPQSNKRKMAHLTSGLAQAAEMERERLQAEHSKELDHALLLSLREQREARQGAPPSAGSSSSARTGPRGLRNNANVCYANALLQSYFALPSLRALVAAIDTDNDPAMHIVVDVDADPSSRPERRCRMRSVAEALQELFVALGDASAPGPASAHTLLSRMLLHAPAGSALRHGAQADVGELNELFVDVLDVWFCRDQDKSAADASDGASPSDASTSAAAAAVEACCPVRSMLFGVLCEQIAVAGTVKRRSQAPFCTLALPLDASLDSTRDVHGALHAFLHSKVTLDDVDGEAEQRTWFERLPELLVLQFKRATFNREAQLAGKNVDAIRITSEPLHMDRYMLENEQLSLKIRALCEEARSRIQDLRKSVSLPRLCFAEFLATHPSWAILF